MKKIEWKKDWYLDGGEIDSQHKILIDILNKIIDRNIDVYELVISLIEYSSNHFVDEEVLMLKNNYPEDKYLLHKQEHRLFTKALLEISFGLVDIVKDINAKSIIKKIKRFCFTWFNSHFLSTDKELFIFIDKGGVTENIVRN
jgi:hemerythrin-like metal-binding protein